MNGKELQSIIRKSGKTQKQLAVEMGMDPTQWTAIIKQADVKSGLVEQVAQLLGMTVGQCYGEAAADTPRLRPVDASLPQQSDDARRPTSSGAVADERALLRQAALVAMQALLAAAPPAVVSGRRDDAREQSVAYLSMRYARALVDEFKKQGL